jgi:hypothetical protein
LFDIGIKKGEIVRQRIVKTSLILVCVLLTAGISLTSWKAVSYHAKAVKYRAKYVDLKSSISKVQADGSTYRSDHIGEKPFYIFMDKEVKWRELAPLLERIYGPQVEKAVVGTFPVPHDYDGTDITGIKSDSETIFFPRYGRFYLHTTIGFFKILLIDPQLSDDEKIISIASFVSGNSVHSMADARKICPIFLRDIYTTDLLLKTFFASDQPLKLHCGYIARFLALLLSEKGYRVQLIQLQTQDRKSGHIVMQVFLPVANKFAMIDPDYGAIVRDESQHILSIQEIAAVVRKKTNSILVEDIGNKTWLKSIYNAPEPMANFAWTPDKSGEVNAVRKNHYLQVLKDYTAVYWIYDRITDGWGQPKKFYRDGSLLLE